MPCRTACKERLSYLREQMKRSMFRMMDRLFSLPPSPDPQSSFGMTLAVTARANPETFAVGVAKLTDDRPEATTVVSGRPVVSAEQ